MERENMVRAAKAGDAAAFTELYRDVYQEMYRFAYYLLHHAEDAKDAVSDAVMDAWAAIGSLREDGSFKQWIFSILANKCKAKMREYVRRPAELTEAVADTLAAPDHIPSAEHLQIREEFRKLDDTDRLIIGLHLFAGYRTRELAEALHMNENTVRSREHRALKRMGEALERV